MVGAPAASPIRNCDPAYPDVCLHQGIGDYDCAGGSGNGPNYYRGGQRGWSLRRLTCTDAKMASPHLIAPVICRGPTPGAPPDPFDLDGNDNDETGCESGEADTPSLTSRSCACGWRLAGHFALWVRVAYDRSSRSTREGP